MTVPPLNGEATVVYQQITPIVPDDGAHAYAAAHLVAAMMGPIEQVTTWAADTDDRPGWALVMDLDTCPDQLLPRLASFTGVQLNPSATPAEARRAIQETEGFQRGTLAGLISDVKKTLTGMQTLAVDERADDQPYIVRITTNPDETPDPAATLAAARSPRRKPLGILINPIESGYSPLIDQGTRTIDAATNTLDAALLTDITGVVVTSPALDDGTRTIDTSTGLIDTAVLSDIT